MPEDNWIDQTTMADLSPWGRACVVHHLLRAMALMHEGQESVRIALDYFEMDATAQHAAVTDALGGRVPLADLTHEQRRLFNRRIDDAVRQRLTHSDYAEDLLTEGIAIVVLEGDDLFEIKPDRSRRRLT